MSRLSWSYLFLSSAAVLLVTAAEASAQTCTTAPSCAELGYTQSASECSGKAMVKCPFDKTKVFCGVTKSCEELGYDKTTTQCSGKKTFVCPYDAAKVACDSGAMVGEIKLWAGSSIPKGWRYCNGASLSKTTFKDLYAVIGTTYGSSGDYFYLPNFQGRVPVGVGYVYGGTGYTYTLAETGGENFTTLSSDQIPDHKHIVPWGEASSSFSASVARPWGNYGSNKPGANKNDSDNTWLISSYMYSRTGYRSAPSSKTSGWGTAGTCTSGQTYSCSTSAHENRMPFLTLYYIIYTGVY
ncbi:MAG: tail fiber protein [Alphaproteobacteria bacterium]|nr:tail fiber protein [Alphaproteobacteria bacterium]